MTTLLNRQTSARPTEHFCTKDWIDETTARRVRQITNLREGAYLGYFRTPRLLPGGWVLGWGQHAEGDLIALDAQSGRVRLLPLRLEGCATKLRESDGRLWVFHIEKREVWSIDLPDGQPQRHAAWPAGVPGALTDLSCDGRWLVFADIQEDTAEFPIPTTMDVQKLWGWFNRKRHGAIWVCDLQTGQYQKIYETQGICPIHLDCSPADPTLLRFAHDMYDAYGQRMWTIRLDGSDVRKIKSQEYGELVTHEFWWADPRYIGYTYQDRRGDETMATLPWAEYSPRATRLGLADLAGREVYLSDPLNSYHSHLFCSADGRLVCGEGTDGHSFVYAAAFDMTRPKLEMVPLATIHTPYVPFRGQSVNSGFSADGKWLLYNDLVGGKMQVCAVEAGV